MFASRTSCYVLRLLSAVVASGIVSCSSSRDDLAAPEAEPEQQPPCDASRTVDDPNLAIGTQNHKDRWSCTYKPGAVPEATVIGDVAGLRAKVKHVFVLMMENRSFDQFLSDLPNTGVQDVAVASNETNPGPDGEPVARYRTEHLCLTDLSHEWLASHAQFDNGFNDGFVASGGRRAMAYYQRDQLKFHYFLAQTFAIGDHHFSSVMGPTWPNHLFFWGGTSCGFAEDAETNPGIITDCGLKAPSIFTALGPRIGVYDDSSALAVGFLTGVYGNLPKSIAEFKRAVAAETKTSTSLPEVVMLGATDKTLKVLNKRQNDDHANVNVQLGQKFIFDIVQTLMSNDDLWRSSVLFITWDESGGFYDHVPPPKACHPENNPSADTPRFDRLGFRVPLYVISPFVVRQYVSKYVTDHASILRFIEAWLDLPAFTARDANAWAMLDYFNFTQPDYSRPNLVSEDAEPTPLGLSECDANPNGFAE